LGADLAPRSASSTSRALTDDARESAARCRSESAPRLLERGLKFVPHACRHMIVDAAHTRNLVAHPFRLQDFRDAVLVHLCLVAPRAAHRPGGLSTRRRSAAARPAPPPPDPGPAAPGPSARSSPPLCLRTTRGGLLLFFQQQTALSCCEAHGPHRSNASAAAAHATVALPNAVIADPPLTSGPETTGSRPGQFSRWP